MLYDPTMSDAARPIEYIQNKHLWLGKFTAMACPCEVLVETLEQAHAKLVCEAAAHAAWRIERTFSRYRDDNLMYRVNHSEGKPIKVNEEFARLLDFADEAYELSDGLFDITSGITRNIWVFKNQTTIPARSQAKALLPYIGWDKVKWEDMHITLPHTMEIDFGGMGKEYAVDVAAEQVAALSPCAFLINFGGDLYTNKPPKAQSAWQVGVKTARAIGQIGSIALQSGAIATSGDEHRFIEVGGKRYSHVINPRTAWPVPDAPKSVSVMAPTCMQAGFFATLAMLKGKQAAAFLDAQGLKHWVQT